MRLIGVGPGDPEQVTVAALRAMRQTDFFVVTDKRRPDGSADPLARARQQLLDRHLGHEPVVVHVPDPERERRPERTDDTAAYERAVADWHAARTDAFEEALLSREGDAGFLVWGDPAFYDSTLRILDDVAARGQVGFELEVLPGISSIQLLAARHHLVLHDVGRALHVTTGRRLREAVDAGEENLVVMLNRDLALDGLDDWRIWWGANLGTDHEELVAGRLGDVRRDLGEARERARAAAGWVMDVFLLRAPR